MIYQDSLNKKFFYDSNGSCKLSGALRPFILGNVFGLWLLQYLNLLYFEITVVHSLWIQTLPLLYVVEGL